MLSFRWGRISPEKRKPFYDSVAPPHVLEKLAGGGGKKNNKAGDDEGSGVANPSKLDDELARAAGNQLQLEGPEIPVPVLLVPVAAAPNKKGGKAAAAKLPSQPPVVLEFTGDKENVKPRKGGGKKGSKVPESTYDHLPSELLSALGLPEKKTKKAATKKKTDVSADTKDEGEMAMHKIFSAYVCILTVLLPGFFMGEKSKNILHRDFQARTANPLLTTRKLELAKETKRSQPMTLNRLKRWMLKTNSPVLRPRLTTPMLINQRKKVC